MAMGDDDDLERSGWQRVTVEVPPDGKPVIGHAEPVRPIIRPSDLAMHLTYEAGQAAGRAEAADEWAEWTDNWCAFTFAVGALWGYDELTLQLKKRGTAHEHV